MPSPQEPSAHLLHADEEQLDRAAIALRTGTAFVLALCPADLRGAALGRLRGRVKGLAFPDPVEVGSAEEMLVALVEQVERRDRVLSLTLGRDAMGALGGLNLHREKVLKGGPVILWLPDPDMLTKMREGAPDAFSFRSTMVVVRGDGGPLPAPKGEEPEEVTRARKRFKRARTPLEKAAAGYVLAEKLRVRGRHREAEPLARSSLDALQAAATDEQYMMRAALCDSLAGIERQKGMQAQQMRWTLRALSDLQNVSLTRALNGMARLKSMFPGPIASYDRLSVVEALDLARRYGLGPETRAQVLRAAGDVALQQGDLPRARALLEERHSLDRYVTPIDRAVVVADFGHIDAVTGNLVAARDRLREAGKAALEEGDLPLGPAVDIMNCLLASGEIVAADAARAEIMGYAQDEASLCWETTRAIEDARGDTAAALEAVHKSIREAMEQKADGSLFKCYAILQASISSWVDAERLFDANLMKTAAEIEAGQNVLLSISGPEGPVYYLIQMLDLRAAVLALDPETLPQALVLSHQSVDLARSTYPDLLPEVGRSLADHLLRARQSENALAVIAAIEPEAASRDFLRERALLLADRVLALVQRGDPPAAIEPAIAALRRALAATGSPRITAETLRDLAKRLPPATTTPDPHALAEEALGLFVAMPMPAQEARCLEIMADVLLARGSVEEAKRRYLTARARLERYGLGLRLPLLDRKIAAIG